MVTPLSGVPSYDLILSRSYSEHGNVKNKAREYH